MLNGIPKEGARPRSIRTRGFHRAHKRGELWIILPYSEFGNVCEGNRFRGFRYAEIHFSVYCKKDCGYIMWPNYYSVDYPYILRFI